MEVPGSLKDSGQAAQAEKCSPKNEREGWVEMDPEDL